MPRFLQLIQEIPVTLALTGLNLVMFLVVWSHDPLFQHQTLIRFGAHYNPLIWEGQYYRLLTCALLHGGLWHLVLNSLALFSLGELLEHVMGSRYFFLLYLLAVITERLDFAQVIPISAETGDGTDVLVDEVFGRLPEIPPMFPAEYSTDRAERFLVAELIREKLILHTRKELPHSVAVVIEEFDEEERGEKEGHGLIRISAMIVVERSSQKGIVIGKRGSKLKQVGSEAREDIEALLGCKVFLKLWVKVDENWSRNQLRMRELGYEEEY